MTSMTSTRRVVTVGVDTHSDTHHVAVIDEVGRPRADVGFPTTPAGHRQLVAWAGEHGEIAAEIAAFGVAGTGAYGAGLARYLRTSGHTVIEVDRPDRNYAGNAARATRSTPPPPRPPCFPAPQQGLRRPATDTLRQSNTTVRDRTATSQQWSHHPGASQSSWDRAKLSVSPRAPPIHTSWHASAISASPSVMVPKTLPGTQP